MANALEVFKRIVREEYKNIVDGVNIHPDGFRDYTKEKNSDFDEPHSTEKMESVNEGACCDSCNDGKVCCSVTEQVNEELMNENPAAAAAAAMAAVQVMNSQGNSIKGTSALRSSDPKTKKKAISIFKRLKDKFSKKKKPTKGVVHNFLGKDFERNEMLNPPNYLDNQAPTPVNSPEEENLVNRGKRDKKSGQPKFGTFRNETKENVVKITKAQIKEIIREELQSINEVKAGLTDDIKKFKTEYDVKHGKLKEKALKLHERQQIMKAVSMVNEKITEMLSELSKLPVTDALENVKKSHANKYIRAIETLKGICEQNAGWLKENK